MADVLFSTLCITGGLPSSLLLSPISPVLSLYVQRPSSRLVLVPAAQPRSEAELGVRVGGGGGGVRVKAAEALREEALADGSTQVVVPWPLDAEELAALLRELLPRFRVLHLANATKVWMGGGDRG